MITIASDGFYKKFYNMTHCTLYLYDICQKSTNKTVKRTKFMWRNGRNSNNWLSVLMMSVLLSTLDYTVWSKLYNQVFWYSTNNSAYQIKALVLTGLNYLPYLFRPFRYLNFIQFVCRLLADQHTMCPWKTWLKPELKV